MSGVDDDDDQTSGVTELPDVTEQRAIYINAVQKQKLCGNRIRLVIYSCKNINLF